MQIRLAIIRLICFIGIVTPLISPVLIYGQENNIQIDSIIARLNFYKESKTSTSLFVHFDKTIYTNQERVYFTAYLLNTDLELSAYHTLSVGLIRNDNRNIYQDEKYVIHKGISSGSFTIPDSLSTGNYSFIVFTNRIANELPEDVFLQPIVIKNSDKRIIASLTLIDSLNSNSDSLHILLKAVDQDYHPIQNTQTDFFIGSGLKSSKKNTLFTDQNGESIFSIPRNSVSDKNNIVHTHFRHKNISKDISLTLPNNLKNPIVGFYPEGGNLIFGVTSIIGWEVKLSEGSPLSISGLLYEDDQIIDTIQTDGYGLGKFRLTPNQNKKYSVKLVYQDYIDSLFQLPTPLASGLVIHILKSITKDTLNIQIRNATISKQILVLIHNFNNLFLVYTLNTIKEIETLSIPLEKIPKGITKITLLDNLYKPLAERLFFAHFDNRPSITLKTYTDQPKNSGKLEIRLKLDSLKGQSTNALVSVACILNSRLDIRRFKDIESYFYLNRVLSDIPYKHIDFGNLLDANDYLENVLLIKGWRRYTWTDLANSNTPDTNIKRESLIISGQILENNKPLTKAIEFNSIVDSTIGVYKTDKSGNFSFEPKDLVVNSENKIRFLVNKDERSIYQFKFLDQYHLLAKKIAAEIDVRNLDLPNRSMNSKDLLFKEESSVHVLDEVIVSATKKGGDYSYFKVSGTMNENECGDYVCYNNILNCKDHKNDMRNRAPVVGEKYYSKYTSIKLNYFGCKELKNNNTASFSFLKGIYDNREFYKETNFESKVIETDNMTTLYWNPSLFLDSEKEIQLSIPISTIIGKVKIIIQGRTNNDVLFKETIVTINNGK